MQCTEWGYATHPNIGGAVMVGLGCEVMQIPDLVDDYGMKESGLFRTMTIQATGETRKTVERGVAMIKEMRRRFNAAAISRSVVTPVARSETMVGFRY